MTDSAKKSNIAIYCLTVAIVAMTLTVGGSVWIVKSKIDDALAKMKTIEKIATDIPKTMERIDKTISKADKMVDNISKRMPDMSKGVIDGIRNGLNKE